MGLCTDMLSVSVTPSGTVVSIEGDTIHLNATASGISETNDFEYQWRKRGLADKVLSFDPVLVISDLSVSDEGDYYCNVTNEWGRSVQSNATVLFVEGMYHPVMLYSQ